MGKPEENAAASYKRIEADGVTVWKSEELEPDGENGAIEIDVCKFLCFQSLKVRGARPKSEVSESACHGE